MATELGKEIWQTDAEAAFAEANRRIAAVLAGETRVLVLADLAALEEMPSQIRRCNRLEAVDFGRSIWKYKQLGRVHRLRDFEWLAHMSSLIRLDLEGMHVSDLSPLSALTSLEWLSCNFTVETKDFNLSLDPLKNLGNLKYLSCKGTTIANLELLPRLSTLKHFNCRGTLVSNLAPLANCEALESIDCSQAGVSDLTPLSGLDSLRSLYCFGTQVSRLPHFRERSALRKLNCDFTRIEDISPLYEFATLEQLAINGTQVDDLSPLAGHGKLQMLDCSNTMVKSLVALKDCKLLAVLSCHNTEVSDLEPLIGCSELQRLNCSKTRIEELAPLSNLTALEHLDCEDTLIDNLGPLEGHHNMRDLNCQLTLVNDLKPLTGLMNLRNLTCNHLDIIDGKPLVELADHSRLNELFAFDCYIEGLPAEVLSNLSRDNCLPRLRAHIADLGSNPVPLSDVKLMVLGNGRIGKSQICNRLRDLPFVSGADPTHGITVSTAPIPERDGVFNIWDFGGQEVYHGTHSLFLSSRAIFLVVWTPESDNSEMTTLDGIRFRNRPMAWWLDFVTGGSTNAPLIAVQNQLDHRDVSALREHLQFCRSVAVSAKTGEGFAALREMLAYATDDFNPPLIGLGRLEVMRRLRDLRAEDAERKAVNRKHQVMSVEDFDAICAEVGGINDARQFLHFLDASGEVFWRAGLFDDWLVLDQAWMLDAIYTIFNLKHCFKALENAGGRFDRDLLATLVWNAAGYSEKEQYLFLGFMEQAGIVFRITDFYETARYIAPDLLPEAPCDLVHMPMANPVTERLSFDILPPLP